MRRRQRALPVDLTAEMTVEEALQRIGLNCLAMIMRNEPAALADVPEGVHERSRRTAMRNCYNGSGSIV